MGVEQMGKEGMEGGQKDGPPLRGRGLGQAEERSLKGYATGRKGAVARAFSLCGVGLLQKQERSLKGYATQEHSLKGRATQRYWRLTSAIVRAFRPRLL